MINFSVFVEKEGDIFVARNLELGVFSQWMDYNEAIENLKEATELFMEWESKKSLINMFTNNQYSLTTMSV